MASSPDYPTLEDVLNAARVQANDAINNLGGEILTDNADFTPVYVNRAWQMFQQYLVSLGYVRFSVPNFVTLNVPPVASLDPAVQPTMSWAGYFDGAILNAAKGFPAKFIKPMKIWERPTQQAGQLDPPPPAAFTVVDPVDTVPPIPKKPYNGIAVWNGDNIQFPGATVPTDIRLDYLSYLPDFTTDPATGLFSPDPSQQICPVSRCKSSFAGFIVYCFDQPRGDLDGEAILSAAKAEAMIIAGVKPEAQ